MALLRLGKAREATHLTAEAYKRHVGYYLESIGYAETRNSAVEGCLADMVFLPQLSAQDRRSLWVEAKATTLSLADEQFAQEIKGYLAAWLNRRPAARFDLYVFARKLRKPESWSRVFGDQLDRTALMDWLAKYSASTAIEQTITAASPKDVVSFFVETNIVDADGPDLEAASTERNQGEDVIHASQKRAAAELELIERRREPIQAKSKLTANLVQYVPPPQYAVITSDCGSLEQIKSMLQGGTIRPPFAYLGQGRLLAVQHPGVVNDFAAIGGEVLEQLDLDEVEHLHAPEHLQLLNRIVEKYIFRRGAAHGHTGFYLLADHDVVEGRPRIIETGGRTLQVATPKPVLQKEPAENQLPKFGALQAQPLHKTAPETSYVFHKGFSAWTKRLWSQYFVNLHMHRVFTQDGALLLDGNRSAALDETFRNPKYNRSEGQARDLDVLADYLFGHDPPWNNRPDWSRQVRFGRLLTIPIGWEPARVDMRVPALYDDGPGSDT